MKKLLSELAAHTAFTLRFPRGSAGVSSSDMHAFCEAASTEGMLSTCQDRANTKRCYKGHGGIFSCDGFPPESDTPESPQLAPPYIESSGTYVIIGFLILAYFILDTGNKRRRSTNESEDELEQSKCALSTSKLPFANPLY